MREGDEVDTLEGEKGTRCRLHFPHPHSAKRNVTSPRVSSQVLPPPAGVGGLRAHCLALNWPERVEGSSPSPGCPPPAHFAPWLSRSAARMDA